MQFEYKTITPESLGNFTDQYNNCLSQIRTLIQNRDLTASSIIKPLFFTKTDEKQDYHILTKNLSDMYSEYFGQDAPNPGFIEQPPEKDLISAEFILPTEIRNRESIAVKKTNGFTYTVAHGSNSKLLFCGGIGGGKEKTPEEEYELAFRKLGAILESEGMLFSDIIRQWNYIENLLEIITSGGTKQQKYQIFNDMRSKYYSRCQWQNGYPAATGIGMKAGSVMIEAIAAKGPGVRTLALNNPRQADAHSYSGKVLIGKPERKKSTPKFERAKYVKMMDEDTVFVSGTAAILGERTVNDFNIHSQTEVTIRNILELVSESNLKRKKIDLGNSKIHLSQLRVYVKKRSDIPAAKEICKLHFPGAEGLYVVSDVCRDNLLVEIECIFTFLC